MVINTDQKVESINRNGCEVLGYAESEIIGKNWFDRFIPETDRQKVRNVFLDIVAGKIEPFEYFEHPVLNNAGEQRLISWHNTVIRDEEGKIVSILSSGTDITERKQAEMALKESEEKYKVLTESSQTGIYIHQDEKIVYANNKFAELYGYTVPELLNINYFELFDPKEGERTLEIRTKRLKGDSAPKSHEVKRIRKDGTPRWCETVAVRIDYQGKKAIMGNIVDISERKQAEEALRSSEARYRTLTNNLNVGVCRNTAGPRTNLSRQIPPS